MAKRRRRGISAGTIVVLLFCAVTLVFAGGVYARISGDMGAISIDPKLLSEPLSVLMHAVTDTEPAAPSSTSSTAFSRDRSNVTAAAPETIQTTPAPTPAPNRTLSLTAVGQVTIGQDLRTAALDRGTGTYAFDSMVQPVASALSGVDLSIATLRTGLTDNPAAYDIYAAPVSLLTGLQASGVNLFNLATDRLLDHGMQGLEATRAATEQARARSAGAYQTLDERYNYPILDLGELKVGLLTYTNSISAAGKKAATEEQIAVATRMLDTASAAQDISSLRAKGADIVIVLAHWGSRSDTKPSKETKSIADALVDAGADVILGTGPTTVHEIERRSVAAGGQSRNVFIAYSLGNFLIDDSRDANDIAGIALHLDIEWDATQRRATIQDAWYMPTWIMRWKDAQGINRFRVVPSGISTIPEGMTDTIYTNMKKSFQQMTKRLGTEAARVRAE